MTDVQPESAPKCVVAPEDLNKASVAIFDGHIGLQFTETGAKRVCARVEVSPALHQPTGVVHGGVYCSIVETIASWGGVLALDGAGHVVGVNNTTDFLRSVRDGVLMATGIPIFQGRRQQLWRVMIIDGTGRECAVGQVRLQNMYTDADKRGPVVEPGPKIC